MSVVWTSVSLPESSPPSLAAGCKQPEDHLPLREKQTFFALWTQPHGKTSRVVQEGNDKKKQKHEESITQQKGVRKGMNGFGEDGKDMAREKQYWLQRNKVFFFYS